MRLLALVMLLALTAQAQTHGIPLKGTPLVEVQAQAQMRQYAYTVADIDSLRTACEWRFCFGTTYPSAFGGMGRSYRPEEKVKAVEEMVRTYMLAGIRACDIYWEDKKRSQIDSTKGR